MALSFTLHRTGTASSVTIAQKSSVGPLNTAGGSEIQKEPAGSVTVQAPIRSTRSLPGVSIVLFS